MEKNEFKAGDVVKLKGGQGPLMVIETVGEETVDVMFWNDGDSFFQQRNFLKDVLTKCPLNNEG